VLCAGLERLEAVTWCSCFPDFRKNVTQFRSYLKVIADGQEQATNFNFPFDLYNGFTVGQNFTGSQAETLCW
jgi:hypothetical protein